MSHWRHQARDSGLWDVPGRSWDTVAGRGSCLRIMAFYPECPTSVQWVTDTEKTLAMEEQECFLPGVTACRHVRRVDERYLVTSVCDVWQTELRLVGEFRHGNRRRWGCLPQTERQFDELPICHPIPWRLDHPSDHVQGRMRQNMVVQFGTTRAIGHLCQTKQTAILLWKAPPTSWWYSYSSPCILQPLF